MEKAQKTRRNPLVVILVIFLALFVGLPLVTVAISRIGRVSPESVIPAECAVYAHVPSPVRFADRLLAHEPLSVLLADPALSAAASAVADMRESGVLQNPLVRFAGKGDLDGAVFPDGSWLACYDAGFLSPLLRLVPTLAGRFTVEHLYYVQAGRNSRFEYRPETGKVIYAAPYRNLLVISDDSERFESVLAGTSRKDDSRSFSPRSFRSREYDAAFLVESGTVLQSVAGSAPDILKFASLFTIPERVELSLKLSDRTLEVSAIMPLSTEVDEISALVGKSSRVPSVYSRLPAETQYCTVLSAGSLPELIAAMSRATATENGKGIGPMLDKADSSARMLLGMSLDELLYSWTGTEFAAFGLEGRPRPVFAVQIADEKKRSQVFDALFSSVALSEDSSVVLDGLRIPRIILPDFLNLLLGFWNVSVPEPYYIVEDGFLYLSESPENLLSTVNAAKKNRNLLRTDLWKRLSVFGDDRSSMTLFYSLDRAIPFFLRGNSAVLEILRLYRQGLVQMHVDDGILSVSLSAISGSGGGVAALPGFPVPTGGRPAALVDGLRFGKKDESRILLVVDGTRAVSYDPSTGERHEYDSGEPCWAIPLADSLPGKPDEPAAWVLTSRGEVSLVNGNMEVVSGFPLATGSRVSAPPAAFGDALFFSDSDGMMHRVSMDGSSSTPALPFSEILRSPPAFARSGKETLMAFYPKSVFGQIWLTGIDGTVRAGWPVEASGIAFGSPVPVTVDNALFLAFLSQSGTLSLYDESGDVADGFPVQLPGVFYSQPVYDGSFLWTVSSTGVLYQVGLAGSVLSQKIPDFSAGEGLAAVTAHDIDRDGECEVFVSGDGNLLYGYSRNFALLAGFPLPLWGQPYFGDINGDGKVECTGVGLDSMLYSWQFR